MKTLSLILLTSLAVLSPCLLAAENWPQLRGPEFNGSSPEGKVPTTFSKTENVAWSVKMSGASASTPVVWKDHVFVTSADKETKAVEAICIDRTTGKERWTKRFESEIARDNKSNYAAPTPATDGKRVLFFFSSGDLLAFDFDGKELWKLNIQEEYGPFTFQWTFSTSPVLYDGVVYMQVLQRDVPVHGQGYKDKKNESYLLALDAATGNELWRHIRPSDAKAESLEAFTTPMIYNHEGQTQLIVCGGDCISGHDIDNKGQEIWRWGTWNPTKIGHWRLVPSPVAAEGIALACAPKREPVYAVKLGGKGNLSDEALAWTSSNKEISSDVPTPVYYGGRFYVLHGNRSTLSCLKPSGEIVWSERLGRTEFEASPTAAGGKLFLMDHGGKVYVVKAGDQFDLLHSAEMGEENARSTRSTIAVAQEQLFIRTNGVLYCIGG